MGSGTILSACWENESSDCILMYAKRDIGDPPQEIEMDLNMLISDFNVATTTSCKGSK